MSITGGPFVAGPLPRNSLAPTGKGGEEAPLYSGMLECPVTTRLRKDIQGSYMVAGTATAKCDAPIATATECFTAANKTLAGARLATKTVSDASKADRCSLTADAATGDVTVSFNSPPAGATPPGCGADGGALTGRAADLVNVAVHLDAATQVATLTLSGPDDVWWGVGFNASAMKDGPWAVVVEGGGKVSEHQLADQGGPPTTTPLAPSVTVASSKVDGGVRTVTLTRPMAGKGPAYYTFPPTANGAYALPFVNAVGAGPTLGFHKDKAPATLWLLPSAGAGACLCSSNPAPFGQGKGTFEYVATAQPADTGSGKVPVQNHCDPEPRSDMLAMKNPTCDVRTYTGGQIACHHMWSLLDADQEIPWADQPLKYHLKFRFWVQDYNASYHTAVSRTTWGIASPVEYDVPKCSDALDEQKAGRCKQTADGNWVHTIKGTFQGSGKLAAAHFHCHARPARVELAISWSRARSLLNRRL